MKNNIGTNKNSLVNKIEKIYQVSKKWVIYFNLILVAILLYFGDYLGTLREVLLPAAIVSTIAILFETLSKLENVLSNTQRKEFHTFAETFPLISEIISNDKELTTIKIITGPGGTTFSALAPVLLSSSKSKVIEIALYLINPESPLAHLYPKHWQNEVSLTLQRMESQINDERIKLTVHLYDNLPIVRGVLINNRHLVLGFFQWVKTPDGYQLSGAEGSHVYCTKENSNDEFLVRMFENWAENCPSKIGYKFPPAKKGTTKIQKSLS